MDAAVQSAAGSDESCANCGATVTGAYCASCGQHAHLYRSLAHMAHEFLHGLVHFDGRFWHTIPLLIARPGKLTRDYVYGRRQRYIAPVALFLLTIFAMFLVFGFAPSVPDEAIRLNGAALAEQAATLEQERAVLEARLDAARRDPARADEVAGLKVALALLGGATAGAASPGAESVQVMTGNERVDGYVRKALANPEFMFYKMKQKGYKLSFLLVPMSLPWMILLFLGKKDVRVYDHVVFLLYSISFMSILFMIAVLLFAMNIKGDGIWGVLFGIVPLAHIFVQLKEAYAIGWLSAAWRAAALAVFATITLTAYAVGILMLGVID